MTDDRSSQEDDSCHQYGQRRGGRGSAAVVVKIKNQRRSVQVVAGEGGGGVGELRLEKEPRGGRKVTLLTQL